MTLSSIGALVIVGAGAGQGLVPGLGALGAVALGLLVLRHPAAGALVLVAIVPVTSGLRRGLPVPGLRPAEVLIAGLALLILVTADRRQAVAWRAFDWLALAYVVTNGLIGSFDLLSRGDPFTAANVGTLFGPLQFLLLYRAVLTALSSSAERRRALKWLLLASVPVSLLGILQQLDVLGVRELMTSITGADLSLDWTYQQLARATGPFPHWHMLGGYLLVIVLLCVSLLLESSGEVLSRRVLAVVLGLAAAALIDTATIAPMLAAVAGALLLGFWLGHLGRIAVWLAAAAVAAAVLFGPLLTGRYDEQFHGGPGSSPLPQTIAYRYEVWSDQYFPALSGRLLTGYGPDLPPEVTWAYTESLYVTLLLRGGIPLLAVYAGLMWALAARARRSTADPDPDQRAVGRVVVVIVVLLIFLHLVMPYFVTTGPPHLLWALAALLFRGEARSDSSGHAVVQKAAEVRTPVVRSA